MLTAKTREYFETKAEQLRNRKYSVLVLGEEGKEDVVIKTRKDMQEFAEYVKVEVDRILKYNKRYENWVLVLTVGLFVVALGFILIGTFYWSRPVVTSAGTIVGLGISITWPIKQLIAFRESNFRLQSLPVTLPILPPDKAYQYVERIFLSGVQTKGAEANV